MAIAARRSGRIGLHLAMGIGIGALYIFFSRLLLFCNLPGDLYPFGHMAAQHRLQRCSRTLVKNAQKNWF